MSESLRLARIHLDPKDLKVLGSLLELAGGRNGISWELVDGRQADAFLIDVDNPKGQQAWRELESGTAPVIALTGQRDFHAWLVLRKPLRSQVVFRTLERVVTELENPVDVDNWPSLEFGDSGALPLAEHLRRQTWEQPVLISGDDVSDLIIDPGAGVWYFSGSDPELTRLLRRQFMSEDGRVLSSADLLQNTNGLEQRNLAALKWRAGLALSSRALHPDLAGSVEFMMPQVPMQALSDTSFSRQARALVQQSLSVRGLIEASQVEPGDV
ncbi:MAG: hypothetical protein ACNA7E_05310, partial [Wenzhouxiangellaceae bacterium]